MRRPLTYGIAGAFFFAFTFILNRSMNLGGGYWLWGACLRYFFTVPLLLIPILKTGQLKGILQEIKRRPGFWLLWSTVGFGLFYAPLSLASVYGESWLIASTWQLTIVCGILLTPLFGHPIPKKNLALSCLILVGIFMMQTSHFSDMAWETLPMTLIPILIAAFCYPLGNRMTMASCPKEISSMQRVFALNLCSLPFWLICGVVSFAQVGAPSMGQTVQSLLVALFSGVIATYLFFKATDLVKHDPKKLALVEATACGEVLFTLLGGVLFLKDALPSPMGFAGIGLIVLGMTANSLVTK